LSGTQWSVGGSDYLSPTYLLTSIPEFLSSVAFRMLADGMVLPDLRAAEESIETWPDWGAFWKKAARRHGEDASGALGRGSRRSAAEHLILASLCAHYGQFLYFDFPAEKAALARLKAGYFRDGAPMLRHPARSAEVPFDGASLPAYLSVPEGTDSFPVVILVGGLDAAKEDFFQFSQLCLERGVAVLAFDGPGQGEAHSVGLRFSAQSHRAISAAIDWLGQADRIDSDRIAVLGRSLGGYLAPRAAAEDRRISACVAWGALYELSNIPQKPPLIRAGYHFITGEDDEQRLSAMLADVTLAGRAEQIACPTLVVHGSLDNSVPADHARRLAREAGAELWMCEGSIHCCHDIAYSIRPAMADWLAEQLGSEGGSGAA
jgi:2,6-dihydroxypseudooxynicotine hydrolase